MTIPDSLKCNTSWVHKRTTKICNFANSWGFGSLTVVNLFAYRSAKPSDLRQVNDPVGLQNDRYLKKAIKSADRVVVAWGNNGKLMQRDRLILELLSKHNIQPHCLGVTKAGYPRHPLYMMCSKQPSVYRYNLYFKVS